MKKAPKKRTRKVKERRLSLLIEPALDRALRDLVKREGGSVEYAMRAILREKLLQIGLPFPTAPETLSSQLDRLARFIMEECPGEPSQDEGAVDTAIRLLRASKRRKRRVS